MTIKISNDRFTPKLIGTVLGGAEHAGLVAVHGGAVLLAAGGTFSEKRSIFWL
jgi:hypothetical protein